MCEHGLAIKPRARWTGHLKICLVTIPMRGYSALSDSDNPAVHQFQKSWHQRPLSSNNTAERPARRLSSRTKPGFNHKALKQDKT